MRIARIENGFVANVIETCASCASEAQQGLSLEGVWVDDPEGHAGIGFEYDAENGAFISPPPFSSWVLNQENEWEPPVPRPDGDFDWDEKTLSWIENLPPLNINTASFEELQSLLGIGPARSQTIIDQRPWSDTADLATIDGINTQMISTWNVTV